MSVSINFINRFNQENNSVSLSKWIHDHPYAVKVSQRASAFFGVAVLLTLPFSFPALGVTVAFGMTIGGTVFILAALSSWVYLKYISCAKHDMDVPSFQEGQCDGGRLFYRNGIPILELTDDPSNPAYGYLAGQAHGYLLGASIYALKKKLDLALHVLLRHPHANKIKNIMDQIREQIPESYKRELKGLSEGYNKWAKEAGIATSMDEYDVLLLHLMADSKHFNPKKAARLGATLMKDVDLAGGLACTSLLHRDPENGVVFGRNMDWCPFGQGGAKSLVIVWKNAKIAILGVPGLIGAITGWNEHRLAMAMNVCPGETNEIRGMPSILFNRLILERASSVNAAKGLLLSHRPLGPYHLTLADPFGEGACISFYQGENNSDQIRSLGNEPLTVLNWRYPNCNGGYFNSNARNTLLNRYFQQAAEQIPENQMDWTQLIDNALKLTPLINSWITLHSLLFVPKTNEAYISWDNGYAASSLKKRIVMSEVF